MVATDEQTARDDNGFALFTVLAVIAFMTVIVVAAWAAAANTLNTSQRVNDDTQAFQAANTAVDVALARIQDLGFDPSQWTTPLVGVNTTGTTYSVIVTPTANSEYLCVATGTYKGRTQTIKVKFFYLNIWNMNLAAGTNNALGGGSVKGTTSVYGPFYVRGGVALGSDSRIENGPLFIKGGDLTLSGSGEIGEAGAIDLYVTGAYPENGSKGMNARTISGSVPDISLPVVDQTYLFGKYGLAKSESFDNTYGYIDSGIAGYECDNGDANTYVSKNPPSNGVSSWYGVSSQKYRMKAPGASSFYKVVGSDYSIANSGEGTHTLTIGGTGSWGSWAGDGHYPSSVPTLSDDFAFDDENNVLYCAGTVFVDGPLVLNEDIEYVGNGTLIANGDITINGNFKPHTGGAGVDAAHCVGLVTPTNIIVHAGTSNAVQPTDPPNVEGAFFAYKDWSMDKNILVKGSVLAGSISFEHANQHLVTNPDLPKYLPRSMPGNGQSVLTKGAWVR